MIDDVLIYYRVLTQAEIALLVSGVRPGEEPVEPAGRLTTTWGSLRRR